MNFEIKKAFFLNLAFVIMSIRENIRLMARASLCQMGSVPLKLVDQKAD